MIKKKIPYPGYQCTFFFFRPKDAVRAFKKRLSQNVGKNFTAVMYTLIVSEI